MKTRIKYYNGNYYPQVKKLVFWQYLEWDDNYAYFKTEEEAVEFVMSGKWKYQNQIVWEGNV